MNETENRRPGSMADLEDKPGASVAEPDEAHITRVVEEYRAALRTGQRPDRQAFLARHPHLADALDECFDALEFIEMLLPNCTRLL